MKSIKTVAAIIGLFSLVVSCNDNAANKTASNNPDSTKSASGKKDLAQIKTEIQQIESDWSVAESAGDVNALAAFYSSDAISMGSGKPMLVGNDAIKKDMAESIAKRPKGMKTSYETMDVFGSDDYVTEIGKTTGWIQQVKWYRQQNIWRFGRNRTANGFVYVT